MSGRLRGDRKHRGDERFAAILGGGFIYPARTLSPTEMEEFRVKWEAAMRGAAMWRPIDIKGSVL